MVDAIHSLKVGGEDSVIDGCAAASDDRGAQRFGAALTNPVTSGSTVPTTTAACWAGGARFFLLTLIIARRSARAFATAVSTSRHASGLRARQSAMTDALPAARNPRRRPNAIAEKATRP